MTRPKGRRPIAAAVILLALGTAPLDGAPTEPRPDGPEGELTVEVTNPDGGRPNGLTPSDFRLVVGGEEAPVLEVAEVPSWRLVVYVDLPLSRPEGVARAAQTLIRNVAPLLRLGEVEVVVSDREPEPFAAPTRDPAELREIFGDLALEASAAGELFALRSEGGSAESPAEAERLYRDQVDGLLSWLFRDRVDRGRILLWVGDLLATDPSSAAAGAGSALNELREALAASGWTLLSLTGEADGPAGAGRGLAELAVATGGATLDGPAPLAAELEGMTNRLRLRFRHPQPFGGPQTLTLTLSPGRSDAKLRAPSHTASVTPEAVSAARARRLLAGVEADGDLAGSDSSGAPEEGAAGYLRVSATYRTEDPETRGREPQAEVEAWVELGPQVRRSTAELRTTLLLERLDAPPLILHRTGNGKELPASSHWLARSRIPLADDVDEIAVVVEELTTGRWGGSLAELADLPERPSTARWVTEELDFGTLLEAPAGGRRAEADPGKSTLIRLLPPRARTVTGRQRFQALVTTVAVETVVFFLDGEEVTRDPDPPFGATVDLGLEARPRRLRALALDRRGRELGEDTLEVNAPRRGFEVTLVRVEADDDGVELEAKVTIPSQRQLERLEMYYNDSRVASFEAPPFRARARRGPNRDTEYVSAVAVLDDGARSEDVRLLGVPGPLERVEVNLVELFVVVSDRDGNPVSELEAADFQVFQGGERRPLQRFAVAEEVPLILGLVIDTSQSMDFLMPETKNAAVRFVTQMITRQDQAFVVDFDNQPRLSQGTTDDLLKLVQSIASLSADGATALYDAIIFSLLQFDRAGGRKALVVLTDGDDYQSRFGYRRVYQSARSGGLPVYVLSLAGLDADRPSFRKTDLEAITSASGGRVFYVNTAEALGAAYDTIAHELRNQYLLAFATDRALTTKELDSIRVELRGKEHRARVVIANP